MCGHVGIAGKLEYKDEKTIKSLLIFDFFRGPDSTGFASIRDNNDVKVAKVASHPLDLFDTKRFCEALSGFHSTVFLGHNRLATKGKVNGINAHPYEYGHIIGAHNGTLEKGSWEALNRIIGYETDVDSQAIFAAIEKVGIEETVKHMQGAWALVWVDMKEGTLNWLRNKERPFWYAYDEQLERVFWASEWPMIDAATTLNGVSYELFENDEGYRFFSTSENWLYSFDLEDLRKGYSERPKPRVKELKGKEPAPVVKYAAGSDPFQRGEIKKTFGGTTPGSTTTSHTSCSVTTIPPVTKTPEVVNIEGFRHNPFGGHLKRERFEEIAKYGCSWCSSSIEWNEPGVTVYEDRSLILCKECSGNGDHSRLYNNPNKTAA